MLRMTGVMKRVCVVSKYLVSEGAIGVQKWWKNG